MTTRFSNDDEVVKYAMRQYANEQRYIVEEVLEDQGQLVLGERHIFPKDDDMRHFIYGECCPKKYIVWVPKGPDAGLGYRGKTFVVEYSGFPDTPVVSYYRNFLFKSPVRYSDDELRESLGLIAAKLKAG